MAYIERVNDDARIWLKGSTFNAITDRQKNKTPPPPGRPSPVKIGGNLLLVKNVTGIPVDAFKPIRIGKPIPDPGTFTDDLAFKTQHVFEGIETTGPLQTGAVGGMWGVAQANMSDYDDVLGLVAIHGITAAIVTIIHARHHFVRLSSSSPFTLESTSLPSRAALMFNPGTGSDKLCKLFLSCLPAVGAHFVTRAGGIPAATGSAPRYKPKSAICDRWEYDEVIDDWVSGGTDTVWNQINELVAANTLIQAKPIKTVYGPRWFADVEPC